MQQAEADSLRQQEANLTALAAIGPRKKRKLDDTPQVWKKLDSFFVLNLCNLFVVWLVTSHFNFT